MPHTFWTLYIALTKKKCKKGKCNEKVGFHYKLWIEVPSFQTCLDGQKLQNNVELLNLSTSVLGTPWLRRSPWKLEILDMPWTQIRSNLAVWIPSGCGGSILQVCKSRRETAFTATHMFINKSLAIKKCPGKMEDNPFCKKLPKTPKKSQFFHLQCYHRCCFQPLSQV